MRLRPPTNEELVLASYPDAYLCGGALFDALGCVTIQRPSEHGAVVVGVGGDVAEAWENAARSIYPDMPPAPE